MDWKNVVINSLIKRDGSLCKVCNRPFDDLAPMEIDHIIPRVRNGEDIIDNLQLLHGICNKKKSWKTETILPLKPNIFKSKIEIIKLKKAQEALLNFKSLEGAAGFLGTSRRSLKYLIDKYGLSYKHPEMWSFEECPNL